MNNRQEGKAAKKASGPKGSYAKCFGSSDSANTYSLIPEVTYVFFSPPIKIIKEKTTKKTHHQKQSEISHKMEDETPSVSYHSNLTLHPSGLSHLH